jgi:hypothetical protein
MSAAILFVSQRLQRLMLAFLCLFLGQVLLAIATPKAPVVNAGTQTVTFMVER